MPPGGDEADGRQRREPAADAGAGGADQGRHHDRPDPARQRVPGSQAGAGRFVVVEYDLENTGDRPIDYMREKLILDGKTYEADGSVSYYLNPKDPMPLQPGMRGPSRPRSTCRPTSAGRMREGVLAAPAAR